MASDPDLEQLRAQRMAQLKTQFQNQQPDDKEKQEAARREGEMVNAMLAQILDQAARARLNSISLVKPERAKMVERMLIQMAQTGQISGKLDDQQLVQILEKVNEQTQKKTTVKFDRRRHALDSDDDD